MTINVVIGPPCAGKSTWAQKNAGTGDVVVDYDLLAKALGSKKEHDVSGSIRFAALAARAAAINRVLRGIDDDAYIIHTNPQPESVESYKEAKVKFIYIDPGKEQCLERARNRPEATIQAINNWYSNPPKVIEELNLNPIKSFHVEFVEGKRDCRGQPMKIEQKLLQAESIELKFDADKGEFEGYASVFNGVDSYGDTIAPGAYKKTLKKRDRGVKMRWNHFGPVIGKWLEMYEDDNGLYVKGQLTPGHSVAADVLASLKHGAIDGLSIGFYPAKYKEDENGNRKLEEIDLVEISVVEEPADNAARITNVKSAIEEAQSLKEIEQILRDAGFNRASATSLVSRVKALAQSDSAPKELAVIAGLIEQVKLPINQ